MDFLSLTLFTNQTQNNTQKKGSLFSILIVKSLSLKPPTDYNWQLFIVLITKLFVEQPMLRRVVNYGADQGSN